MEPPGKTKGKGEEKRAVPQLRTYGTSLTQDNYWCVPPGDDGAIWWFVEGDRWTSPLVEVLDRCLDRLVYFGRAESFTAIRRVEGSGPTPNCKLLDRPNSTSSVKILAPAHTAARADIERITDDPQLASSVPPGAQFMYADLPPRPPARDEPLPFPTRADCRFMQIAIGWNVPPEPRAVVRLTERFRSAVLGELLTAKTGKRGGNWSSASISVRSQYADMFGKDAEGSPDPHEHTEFFVWWGGTIADTPYCVAKGQAIRRQRTSCNPACCIAQAVVGCIWPRCRRVEDSTDSSGHRSARPARL